MPAPEDLVLLTGATGFIGYVVLVKLLEGGYPVRCAVRSPSKMAQLRSTPSIQALDPTQTLVSCAIVPDMNAPNAYEEAVKGAKYIIHVAFPLPSFGENRPSEDELERIYIEPARRGTTDLLEAARKAGSVKRIVLTSSIVAIIPAEYFMGTGDDKSFDADSRIPSPPGPYPDDHVAYRASKAIALNTAEAYIRTEKPSFDITSVVPGWVLGRNELLNRPEDLIKGGSNSMLLKPLLGEERPFSLNANYVHVYDVAKIHVLALDPKVPGNQAFVASSDSVTCPAWEEAFSIVDEAFPGAVKDGKLKKTGKQPTHSIRIETQKTKGLLDGEYLSFEQQVKDTAGQYLELLGTK